MSKIAFNWAVVFAFVAVTKPAYAIRPFVTDDARVVGYKLAQLETWVLFDRQVFEHNVLPAVGPTDWLELTLGGVHGAVHSGTQRGYSVMGPVFQGKVLVLPAFDTSWPGFAFAAGFLPAMGYGPFVPSGSSGFGYVACTESLFKEDLLLHVNLGLAFGETAESSETASVGEQRDTKRMLATFGFGLQARIVAGLHAMGEVYYGDPYDPTFAVVATQIGSRYVFSKHVQVDGTFGSTLGKFADVEGHAQTERWGTLGLRVVTSELW